MRNDLSVDLPRTNMILSDKRCELAQLTAFTLRMRRKALPENSRVTRRLNEEVYWKTWYNNPPTSDKCPLCQEKEKKNHAMTCCPKTRQLRRESANKIKEIISRKGGVEPPNIPCWWAHDIGELTPDGLGAFKRKWGAMGIIPRALAGWLWEEIGIQGRRELDEAIAEIQIEILNCSHQCWKLRVKISMKKSLQPAGNGSDASNTPPREVIGGS